VKEENSSSSDNKNIAELEDDKTLVKRTLVKTRPKNPQI